MLVSKKRIPPVRELLAEAAKRWGMSKALICDRWRLDELRDALLDDDLPWRSARLVPRGQGFKEDSTAIRAWRKATIAERVRPVKCGLLTYQLSEAVCVSDPAGNSKLARDAQGGRRRQIRDDVVAATLLAVEFGLPLEDATRHEWRIGVA